MIHDRTPTLERVKPRPGHGPSYKIRKPGTSRVLFMGPEDLKALRDQIDHYLDQPQPVSTLHNPLRNTP